MRQEDASAAGTVLDVDFLTKDLVAVLLMVPAEETHQVGNQGNAQKDRQAEEQDTDDLAKATVGLLLPFVFLRLGLFVFR